MAQPRYPPPRPFSPPISSPSPGVPSPDGGYLPPAKRQRLSPNAHSPYNSPSFGTLPLPNAGSPVNGATVNGTYNSMAPPAPAGSMGPPSRPVEKATDTTELTDVLAQSGIDLREEEASLTHSYINPLSQQTNFNSSFNSQGSSTGTISAGNSFNDVFHSRQPGPQSTFYGAGVFNQPSLPYKSPEELAKEEQEKAAQRQANREQYHLNDPFLAMDLVVKTVEKRGYDQHVNINREGLYKPVPGQRAYTTEVVGPDGTSVVVTKGQTLLNHENTPLVDILTLLSLACEERVRGVVEHSAILSNERRTHSHGVVPPEWTDLAVGNGVDLAPAVPNTARSGWESAVSPTTMPLKRSLSITKLPSVPSESRGTLTVPNYAAQAFRKSSQMERTEEDDRLAKRAQRGISAVLNKDGSRSASVSLSTPRAGTPTGLLGDRAPEPMDKKPTKKELKKQAETKASEEQQHRHAIETARMATSNMTFGGKKKTYSWLTGPAKSNPTGFPAPSKINTVLGNSTPGTPGAPGAGSGGPSGMVSATGKRFGEWREDGERGAGIQKRDVLFVLEMDGKALKDIQKAYSKEDKE